MKTAPATILFAILCANLALASSDTAAGAQALIEQASTKTNIFDLSGLRMTANVRIDNAGKPINGTYSLLENSPDQWREEITFPGYSEVRVGTNGLVYLKRSTDFEPYRISQLRRTIGFGERLHPGPYAGESIKRIRERKIAGAKVKCVEIATEQGYAREVCVDEIAGVLRRDQQGFTDTDFRPVGTKLFPRSMSLKHDGKMLVQVVVSELSIGNSLPTDLFQPLPGSISKAGCLNATLPHKIRDVVPRYPDADKVARNQGMVAVYATISAAGSVGGLRVVQGASSTLNESALTSLAQWKYAPATCNGNPVETETVVEIHYTLSY